MLFTIHYLRSISFFCQNAHHDWLTKEYISNWFLVNYLTFTCSFPTSPTVPVSVTRILPDQPPFANLSWPNTRFINETDTANLICETKGTEVINIVWMFQNTCEPCDDPKCKRHYPCYGSRCGARYDEERIPQRMVFSRTLRIPDISREYTGCYKCEAQNSKAIDQKHFKLIVQCKYIILFTKGQKVN